MQTNEEKRDHDHLPILKKMPFVENVQQLHRYNLHVADVCFRSGNKTLENYHSNKDRYEKQVQPKKDERINAAAQMEQEKRKTLENKHKELKKRNLQNLGKLEHFLAQKRQQITKKEKKMMEESFIRRQQHLKTLTTSFHHSQDKRYHIRQRQSKEMERSLLLYDEHQKKLQAANNRRSEFLSDIKCMLKTQNEGILQAQQICKSRDQRKEEASWKKLIKKYEAADMLQSTLNNIAQKRIEDRKKQEQKVMQKHWKKRSNLEQHKEKLNEQQMKKQQQKIEKANIIKEKKLENVAQTIESKRKMKEKQLMFNTFYMQEDEEKRITGIHKKQHYSQIFLTTLKQEKERLHSQNLYDSLATTLRR